MKKKGGKEKNYRIRNESFFFPLPPGKRGNCRRNFGVATVKGKFGGWFYCALSLSLSSPLPPSFFTVYRSFLFFFYFFSFFYGDPYLTDNRIKSFPAVETGVLFYANKPKSSLSAATK